MLKREECPSQFLFKLNLLNTSETSGDLVHKIGENSPHCTPKFNPLHDIVAEYFILSDC